MSHASASLFTRRDWWRPLCALVLATATLSATAEDLEDLPKIKAAGVLTVALYKDNAPYSDGEGENASGVDVALAQALAKALGVRANVLAFQADENMGDDLRNMVWKGHYLGVGPADVMLHVPVDKYLIDNTPRTLIFAPYAREQLVLLHRLSTLDGVNDLADLSGKRLVAEQGSGAASLLMGQRGGLLRANVSLRANGLQAAQAVIDNQADAAYLTRAQAEAAVFKAKANPADFGFTSLPLNGLAGSASHGWPIGMAIKSSNQRLGMAIEDALDQLRQTGELQRIYNSRGLTLVTP